MKNTIHLIYFLIFLSYQVNAQRIPASEKIAPHTTLTLEDKVNKSDVIIEGEVISGNFEYGFRGPQGNVFSSKIIRISKIFKGDLKDTIVELIIEGGVVPSGPNRGGQTGPDGSSIGKGEECVFFLRNNNTNIQSGKHIQSYFFLYFNSLIVYTTYKSLHETRIEGKTTSDFENDIYKRIEAITGTPRKITGLMPFEIEMQKHPPNLDGDTTITFPNGNRMRVFKKDLKN